MIDVFADLVKEVKSILSSILEPASCLGCNLGPILSNLLNGALEILTNLIGKATKVPSNIAPLACTVAQILIVISKALKCIVDILTPILKNQSITYTGCRIFLDVNGLVANIVTTVKNILSDLSCGLVSIELWKKNFSNQYSAKYYPFLFLQTQNVNNIVPALFNTLCLLISLPSTLQTITTSLQNKLPIVKLQ